MGSDVKKIKIPDFLSITIFTVNVGSFFPKLHMSYISIIILYHKHSLSTKFNMAAHLSQKFMLGRCIAKKAEMSLRNLIHYNYGCWKKKIEQSFFINVFGIKISQY